MKQLNNQLVASYRVFELGKWGKIWAAALDIKKLCYDQRKQKSTGVCNRQKSLKNNTKLS